MMICLLHPLLEHQLRLPLVELALDVFLLAEQHVEVEVDLRDLRLPRLDRLLDHVRRVPLERLDPHVVVPEGARGRGRV